MILLSCITYTSLFYINLDNTKTIRGREYSVRRGKCGDRQKNFLMVAFFFEILRLSKYFQMGLHIFIITVL